MKKTNRKMGLLLAAAIMMGATACNSDAKTDESTTTEATTTTAATTVAVTETIDANLSVVDFVDGITVGWNLGNTLDAHVKGQTGLTTETSWGNPKTTEQHILAVKNAGFNTVRVPTTWGNHMDESYKIDEEWMNRVEEIVRYGYDNDMYVILNTHHEGDHWLNLEPENEAVVTEQLVAIWEQISERFEPYNEMLIFEGLNEPRTNGAANEWNGGNAEQRKVLNNLTQAFVDTVRASGGNNVNRFLMVTPMAANTGANALNEFVVPDDNKLIVSVHAYSPYNLALNRFSDETEFTAKGEQELNNLMKSLNDRYISKGIPVIMGEFGSINKKNLEDRAALAEYYVSQATKNGIPCVWWDNGSDVLPELGESFLLIDRKTNEIKYPEIVDAIMNGLKAE